MTALNLESPSTIELHPSDQKGSKFVSSIPFPHLASTSDASDTSPDNSSTELGSSVATISSGPLPQFPGNNLRAKQDLKFSQRLRQMWRQFLRFCGPGYMIAVGYMDPGNWATDIEAGSRYGYALLFIILLSSVMAMVLQHLCVRLGVATGQDLAQACRRRLPQWANIPMYLIAEIAIISCDLAEVIGTAIALKLLFGLPILGGVFVTVADVLLLLVGLNSGSKQKTTQPTPALTTTSKSPINTVEDSPVTDNAAEEDESAAYRILEVIVIVLMSIIGLCFIIQLFIVKPQWGSVLWGFLPVDASKLIFDSKALFAALGIVGATVMPHNLYLHSSIVKYNMEPENHDEKADSHDQKSDSNNNTIANMIKWTTLDSTIALIFAMFINAAILITAAAAFHARGQHDVHHIEDASALMRSWLGPLSAILFGLALLAAGQSSTVTGTMAGQIVFEGHLRMRMSPWLRRLITRAVAILPAVLIIAIMGEDRINELLIYSQVILSFQLPFAVIPLIFFSFSPPTHEEAACIDNGNVANNIEEVRQHHYSQKRKEYWEDRKGSKWEKPLFIVSCSIAAILVILNLMTLVSP